MQTLTPVEHELMAILWKLGQGTVREVMAQLPIGRDLAYTSVSTMLRILEQKKILNTVKNGRQHIYIPAITQEAYSASTVNKMVSQVFAGDSVAMVSYLVKDNISINEIDEIQKLLDAKKKEIKS